MPLLNGKLWQPSHVQPSATLSQDSQVFRMGQTGEYFYTYEDYLERLRLLQSKQWGSLSTGKNGLNYQQALFEDCNADELTAKVCLDLLTCVYSLKLQLHKVWRTTVTERSSRKPGKALQEFRKS